jgi:hypothetical protein
MTPDDKLKLYILKQFKRDFPTDHITDCADISVINVDSEDGSYGCDTGCEYVRLTADITCPHIETPHHYEYGEFGELADIIAAMEYIA